MDNRSEVRDFLMSRRARVEPEDVGLARGTDRRVPGLRRGEAAALAGVSVEYYARLERGAIAGASEAVLDGLAKALQMDDVEREYLRRLAHQAGGIKTGSRSRATPAPAWRPSPSIQWFLNSMESAVAMIGNGRTDLLAWNPLGGALMEEMIVSATTSPPNFARFIFLEPVARRFYPDWDAIAGINVAQLRTEAGRDPHSKQLHDLVGELSTRSDQFRQLWGRHDVWEHQSGTKRFHHHTVGDLTLHFNGLDLVGHEAVQLTVLTAEPGSSDHEALQLLGTVTAPVRRPDDASHHRSTSR
ncbi:helix-turn-helix transcriptional regulator [Microbacterium rhizomatis]|uniref:Helix-turn-helix domain-containing protein n=1 Tax=Microbacterium rhizomatis TaxID=1631477 RepID=A0A5J5J164_9MICO|nr:helix-turn-helix transcriptional regulator [Microbacterium rhizomatis]KAA9108087.1 helix-turn-helix domain-containing protein [Microbacterium rhizomatis]